MSLSKIRRLRPGFDHDDQDPPILITDAASGSTPTAGGPATPKRRRRKGAPGSGSSPLTVSPSARPHLPQSLALPMKLLNAKDFDAAVWVTSQALGGVGKCHLCLRPLATENFLQGHPSSTISFDNGPHLSELPVCGPCVHTCHVDQPGVSKHRLALMISKSDASRALHINRFQDGKPFDNVGGYLDTSQSASHGRESAVHSSKSASLGLDETFGYLWPLTLCSSKGVKYEQSDIVKIEIGGVDHIGILRDPDLGWGAGVKKLYMRYHDDVENRRKAGDSSTFST